MRPFTFIHASDLHLDTPFEGVGKVDASLQAKLRDASLAAFDNLIRAAVERRVDFVVIAGDIYDGAERGIRAQAKFLGGLRALDRAGISSFFVYGNHDPVGEGWSAIRAGDFPASAAQFGQSDAVQHKIVARDGEPIAAVHGISFRTKSETRNLSRMFSARAAEAPFHVAVLHTNVGDSREHGNYAPCSMDDLRAGGFDYWALGHIHKRAVLQDSKPFIVYSGNTQARSFKEPGPKGATLVSVDGAGRVALEKLVLDVVRFSELTVDAAGCESLDQVWELAKAAVDAAVEQAGGRYLLTRIELTGATSAHGDILKAKERDELIPTLRDMLDVRHAWLDDATVGTLPVIDRAAILKSTQFESALVKLSDELQASAERRAALRAKISGGFRKSSKLAGYMADISDDEFDALIRRAESHLLAVLQEDAP